MPKLHDQAIARNQAQIEHAALRLFTRQGYHGTSVRQIAAAADVSTGNLYNYYPTKQALFGAVVRRYEARVEVLRRTILGAVEHPFEARELERLAQGIRVIVYGHPDYWRLMYIDVIEFGSRHFAHTFRSLAHNMRERLGARFRVAARSGPWGGIDPALGFTAIYLQLFTYYLVEKLFGGRQHLGKPDEQAVAQLIEMALRGLWRDGAKRAGEGGKRGRT